MICCKELFVTIFLQQTNYILLLYGCRPVFADMDIYKILLWPGSAFVFVSFRISFGSESTQKGMMFFLNQIIIRP